MNYDSWKLQTDIDEQDEFDRKFPPEKDENLCLDDVCTFCNKVECNCYA